MKNKIRKAMGDRDARYRPAGLVELDDAFFGPRRSNRKPTVLCAVSLYRNPDGVDRPGFAHLRVVDGASAKTIAAFLDRLGGGVTTEEGRQLLEAIRSDGWRAYGRAAKDRRWSIAGWCSAIRRRPGNSSPGSIASFPM